MTARYIVGDTRAVLATLPDASVDLVLTSPPFLALRSYLPADHPDKALEMGSEATPGEFIDALVDVVEACGRVLAPHGSICFELGDTYAGSGGAGGDYNAEGLRAGQEKFSGSALKRARLGVGDDYRPSRSGRSAAAWPEDKSLCLIPELLRFTLAYGFNPLTGRETERWRVRNVVRWCRPNPPVGALADKFRPATSEMVVACRGRKRYFDLDSVRGPASPNTHARTARGVESRQSSGKTADDERRGGNFSTLDTLHSTDGAPPLDWWNVPTEPYKGSHYATWPTALLTRPILAMCPQRVCETCGKPSERITEANYIDLPGGHSGKRRSGAEPDSNNRGLNAGLPPKASAPITTGWTDCGHDNWRRGHVLDPFGGSGTTAVVALGHGRDCTLIDLDSRNAELARERVGMWLEVEEHATEGAA